MLRRNKQLADKTPPVARPGDIYHPDFINEKPAFFDVTVRNSLQSCYGVTCATSAGTAALAGEGEKTSAMKKTLFLLDVCSSP